MGKMDKKNRIKFDMDAWNKSRDDVISKCPDYKERGAN